MHANYILNEKLYLHYYYLFDKTILAFAFVCQIYPFYTIYLYIYPLLKLIIKEPFSAAFS